MSVGGFKFIDLFAGIGGFHLAMAELGGECVFASEIDRECRAMYETNFGIEPAGDIKPLTEGPFVDIPDHDVLCAGFPCQPFSKSGAQLGMDETRGTLLFNILKILEAKQPRFVILENVRNLAGPRQSRAWQTITYNLRLLGYQVADKPAVFSPHLLRPEEGGRPQVRERVFILAERVGGDEAWKVPDPLVDRKPSEGWDPKDWRIKDWLQNDAEIADPGRYTLRPNEIRWLAAWDDFIKQLSKHEALPGFPIWADAFKHRAQVYPWTPPWKANFLEKNAALYRRNKVWITAWKREHKVDQFPESRRKFEWQARGWEPNLDDLVMHLRPSGIRVKGPTYLPALVAITQTSIIGERGRRITPREAARLQSLPEGFVLHETNSVAYRQLGNAVNVGVVKHVAKRLFDSSDEGWPGLEAEPDTVTAAS